MQTTPLTGLSWYHLKLGPGADLFQGLRDFFKQQGLKRAFVLSCIGSLQKAVLAFPKTKEIPPQIESLAIEGLFELNGIAGEVWQEAGEIKVHLHGSLTKAGKEVFGGAINQGTEIFKLAEMVIAGLK